MRTAVNYFETEQDKIDYIKKTEDAFEVAIDRTVAKILEGLSSHILTLSGPTCSGKTTMAKKLVAELAERGKRVHVVSIDDFFFDRDKLAADAKKRGVALDFDSPLSMDLEAFSHAVQEILQGTEVALPVFDFKEGRRTGFRSLTAGENDIFIFEGIQAVYPEVTGLLGSTPYRSIYVSVMESLSVNGTVFSPNQIRFFRRLVRDTRFRGATPPFTFYLWDSVRENEETNIFPYASSADVTFNTLIDYGVGMLKPSLEKLLKELPDRDVHKDTAERMLLSLEGVTPIDEKYLPPKSVYHEFLG